MGSTPDSRSCIIVRAQRHRLDADKFPMFSVGWTWPYNTISVVRQVHDGMRACERLDGGVCSGWLTVEQGLRQGCVLAHLLFNIFFAAVVNVAYTHFKADQDIIDALVRLRKKRGAGGRGGGYNHRRASPGHAGVVSQKPE